VSGTAKPTSDTMTEKFKERDTPSMDRCDGVHVKFTEYCLEGVLVARRPLDTTEPVSTSSSRLLLTIRSEEGWSIATVSVSVCDNPQSAMKNTEGPDMEATGRAKTKTDVAPPDLMTVEPVCVMILRTVEPATGKAGDVHKTRVVLEAETATDVTTIPLVDMIIMLHIVTAE
jgi:hypothetical protein